MRRFGPAWNEAMEELDEVPVPVGELCSWCNEPIREGQYGLLMPAGLVFEAMASTEVPIHYECQIRSISGSVGHQRHTCSCFGGTEEDPPELSRREAAIAAAYYAEGRRTAERDSLRPTLQQLARAGFHHN